MSKRVFIVGGTGFLGYHAALEFLKAGWDVVAAGLPPAPPTGILPPEVQIQLQDYTRTPDAELLYQLHGVTALVFAAGLDDRSTPAKPAFPKFRQANVLAPQRLFQLAAQAGVKRAVVLGSYFAYFNRQWPELHLADHHPYIRSRVEQEKALTSIPGLETCILELPYIFGRMPVPGWKPLWTPLVKYIRSSRIVFYMKGGTACISARTVGRAILGAAENGRSGESYPIGQENLSWAQMLSRLAAADGRQLTVKTLPTGLIRLALRVVHVAQTLQGREGGLDLRHFAPLQTANTFVDPQPSQTALGFVPSPLDEAFGETVSACS